MPESVSKSGTGAGDSGVSGARGLGSVWPRPAARSPRLAAVSVRAAALAMVRHPFDQITRRAIRGNRPLEHLIRGTVQKRPKALPPPRPLEKPLAHRVFQARADLLAPEPPRHGGIPEVGPVLLDRLVQLLDPPPFRGDRIHDRRTPRGRGAQGERR